MTYDVIPIIVERWTKVNTAFTDEQGIVLPPIPHSGGVPISEGDTTFIGDWLGAMFEARR
jgi:hypothetical protein